METYTVMYVQEQIFSNSKTKSLKTALEKFKTNLYKIERNNIKAQIVSLKKDPNNKKLIEELKNKKPNIYVLAFSLDEYPEIISKFILKQTEVTRPKIFVNSFDILSRELISEAKATLKQITSIVDPTQLFTVLGLITSPDLKNILITKFNLTAKLLPKTDDSSLFENFNIIEHKEKGITRVSKETELTYIKSDIAKKFESIEPEIINELTLADFSEIPDELITKYITKINKLNSLFNILGNFQQAPDNSLKTMRSRIANWSFESEQINDLYLSQMKNKTQNINKEIWLNQTKNTYYNLLNNLILEKRNKNIDVPLITKLFVTLGVIIRLPDYSDVIIKSIVKLLDDFINDLPTQTLRILISNVLLRYFQVMEIKRKTLSKLVAFNDAKLRAIYFKQKEPSLEMNEELQEPETESENIDAHHSINFFDDDAYTNLFDT